MLIELTARFQRTVCEFDDKIRALTRRRPRSCALTDSHTEVTIKPLPQRRILRKLNKFAAASRRLLHFQVGEPSGATMHIIKKLRNKIITKCIALSEQKQQCMIFLVFVCVEGAVVAFRAYVIAALKTEFDNIIKPI